MDPYAILDISCHATPVQIKAAYRKQARKHHPDRTGGDAAWMAKVNEANDILSDPKRRAQYDESGYTGPVEQSIEIVFFNSLVKTSLYSKGNIVSNMIREIELILKAGREVIREAKARLAQLQVRVKMIKGPKDSNLLVSVLEDHIAELNAEIEFAHIKLQGCEKVKLMMLDYSSSESEKGPPSKAKEDYNDVIDELLANMANKGSRTPQGR